MISHRRHCDVSAQTLNLQTLFSFIYRSSSDEAITVKNVSSYFLTFAFVIHSDVIHSVTEKDIILTENYFFLVASSVIFKVIVKILINYK